MKYDARGKTITEIMSTKEGALWAESVMKSPVKVMGDGAYWQTDEQGVGWIVPSDQVVEMVG